MKQTNNAIKFLMAQYRAIFKNANIAMVAAMVAALAAGQSQAADVALWKDVATGVYNGGSAQDDKTLNVVVNATADNNKTSADNLVVTITSGSGHFIKGASGHNALDTTADSKTTTITLNGDGKAVAQPTLTIGGTQADEHVAVTITNLNNYAGTLSIVGQGKNKSSLTATNIQIGGSAPAADGAAKAAAESKAVVSLGASGEIIAAKGGTFNILNGGELKFAGAASKAKAESGITLNGGKISVADSATGTVDGALTVTDGAVEVNGGAKENTLTFENLVTVNGGKFDVLKGATSGGKATLKKGLTMNSGTLTVQGDTTADKSGKLEVSGDAAFKSNSKLVVEKNASAKFGGNATFASGTVTNSGTIEAVKGATINTDGTAGLYSESGLLKLTGATLNFTGSALDLTAKASNISGNESSALIAEKGSVTVDKSFNTKVNSVTASTIVAKTVKESIADLNISDRNFLFISGGSLTALNELKGSQANSEIAIFNNTGTPTLNLGSDETTNGKLTDISRIYVGATLAGAKANPTLNVSGKWDFANAMVSVGNGGKLNIKNGADVSNIERLQIFGESGNTITTIDGTLTIQRLLGNENYTKDDAGKIEVNGTFNITGNGKADGPSAADKYSNDVQLSKVTLNINAGGTVALTTKDAWDDVLKETTDSGTGITTFEVVASGGNTTDFGSWKKENVKLNAGGTLRMDLSGYKVADKAALDKLAADLKAADSKGLIDFGGLSIGTVETNADGSIELDKMPTAKTEATQNLEVNLGNDISLDKSYSMGSANVSGNSLTVENGITLEFNNAKNGQFATNKDAAAAADSKVNVTLAENSALNLNGNGSLGDITKSGDKTSVVLGGNNGTQTVGVVDVATFNQVGGNVTTAGAITATDMSVNGVLNAGGNITTSKLDIDGGAIKAAGKDITVSGGDSADIFGDVEAGSLSLSGGATIAGDADVKLGTLNLSGGKTLNVGRDGEDGSSAAVFTDKLVIGAGSTIFVDPEYKKDAAILAAQSLTDDAAKEDTGIIKGSIFVGKNAAFGYGYDQANFDSVMANYLVDGKFVDPDENKGGYANALVLNKPVLVAKDQGIVVDYTKTANDLSTAPANKVELGKNSVLIVTDNAVANGAAITLGQGAATASYTATVTADASAKISLVGDFNAKSTDIKLFALDGSSGTLSITNDIQVEALGGLVVGTLRKGEKGTLGQLGLSDNAKTMAYVGVARPVGDFFLGLAEGKYALDKNQVGYDFVITTMNVDGGFQVIDTAAHAATYAGAQQAAVASVTTMADAMFGRVGAVGVEAASISATGSQANGGVWLTPMYKSMDSDGFNAEGASYGSDVDLGGVAFGADTVNGNMRFGAVFNIGSGDSEGKGQGNGLKDEFDYYGFGIYSAMGFGNFALVGDASMTVISHEVEGLGLKGKADTTAVTMGLTGQYAFSTPMVDVVPHAGVRFTRLDTESYDLNSAKGVVGTTDFDVQNVFSVPLGVTLSKGFVTGGWTLAPSADLTVAFNTGDTEAKSTTTFTGIGHGINMNTEVLDEVQYGLTLGLGAQYGAFGTSLNVNYTGSSNTYSFGVNAQARYMF